MYCWFSDTFKSNFSPYKKERKIFVKFVLVKSTNGQNVNPNKRKKYEKICFNTDNFICCIMLKR